MATKKQGLPTITWIVLLVMIAAVAIGAVLAAQEMQSARNIAGTTSMNHVLTDIATNRP